MYDAPNTIRIHSTERAVFEHYRNLMQRRAILHYVGKHWIVENIHVVSPEWCFKVDVLLREVFDVDYVPRQEPAMLSR